MEGSETGGEHLRGDVGPAPESPSEFIESILNVLPRPVFVKDEQHRWILLNDACCRFIGRPREELIGRSDYDVFSAEQADVFWQKDDVVFRTGEPNENEELITDAAGETHVILTRKSRHVDWAGRSILVGVITEITDRKAMEDELRRSRDELDKRIAERTAELERANAQLREDQQALQEGDRRKNEFLAALGHELRNPLTPIRTAVYLMRRFATDNPELSRLQVIIERQITHMTRLIDDLLDLSRISRGKIALRKERVDVVGLVRSAVGDREESMRAHGLTIRLSLCEGPVFLDADPARIAQVVGNLLDNAEKFTDPGGNISVTVAPTPDPAGVVISVRDTGIGMSAETLKRVFVAFSQGEHSEQRGRVGLGLGLSLVKTLVELHRGTVSARSDGSGRGSELAFWLPLAGTESVATPVPPPVESGPRSLHRVLVIEDNEEAAELLEMTLSMAGHFVAVASTGEEGLSRAREMRPDVVLSDIGLPGRIDGYEVARILRRDGLSAAHLIAVTGYGRDEDRRRALDAGFERHITKPVDVVALEKLVSAFPPAPTDASGGQGT